MKKLFYTLSLLCFFVTYSFAQDANAVEPQELTKKEKRQLKSLNEQKKANPRLKLVKFRFKKREIPPGYQLMSR
jgi:hypothetical protein